MEVLDLIIYITIAFSGCVFGSFFTLAVHRIPRHEDITHERSYCPNCGHKLHFLPDLIPVLSYIFLGGKCHYCHAPIRPRYLILEVCSGLVFLTLALINHINFETVMYSPIDLVNFIFNVLFICCMFITAGIDKEKFNIPNGLMIYGLIISIAKVVFMLVTNSSIVPNILGLLVLPVLCILTNVIYTKVLKREVEPIGNGDIKYLAILGLFFGFGAQMVGLFLTAICNLVDLIIQFICPILLCGKNNQKLQVPLGFFLSIGFTLLMIFMPYLTEYINVCNFMLGVK